jgi:hypothetical protein
MNIFRKLLIIDLIEVRKEMQKSCIIQEKKKGKNLIFNHKIFKILDLHSKRKEYKRLSIFNFIFHFKNVLLDKA